MVHIITPATPADFDAIDEILRAAFPGPEEAELVRALRRDGDMVLELVARAPDLVGHVAVSRLVAPAGWLCLAPLAILRYARGRQIGSDLTKAVVAYAVEVEKRPICVLGNVAFYERCGFSQARAAKLTSRYPAEFTMLAGPGAEMPSAELIYPPAFDSV